ncbi:hypothetical protein MHA_1402 [Mannheimia haemolytica PHL213]|nr:hypothetical protein MHA_1402 [Mannheimia haemolytica PHL213]
MNYRKLIKYNQTQNLHKIYERFSYLIKGGNL